MSDFDEAITDILEVKKLEGIYSNDPNDPGGETKYGISHLSYPHLDIKNLAIEDAKRIYYTDWWVKFKYGEVNDQDISEKLLSFSINMGSVNAHICIQRAVRSATANENILSSDGIFGPKTIYAVNSSDPKMLLAALRSEGACHYRMRKNPIDETGLENRAYD